MYILRDEFEGPWYSAGRQFGWKGPGISILKKHFGGMGPDEYIGLTLSGKKYKIRKDEAFRLAEKYHSTWEKKDTGEPCITIPVSSLELCGPGKDNKCFR